MKEFIEKLIGRLEEYKYSHLVEHDKERLEHCTENERAEHCEGIDCFWCVWNKSISIVNELAEEYNGGWIPCSERLPDKSGNYIVCNKHSEIWVANWFNNTWWGIEKRCRWGNIIAWQPLPEPYCEKS